METHTLMNQAKKILSTYACRDLEGEEKVEMNRQVEQFFARRASRLSKSEIMEHMATPMKALAWFNTYLCESFWNRCCSGSLPEDSDTCMMEA